jgi:hypothetical protein
MQISSIGLSISAYIGMARTTENSRHGIWRVLKIDFRVLLISWGSGVVAQPHCNSSLKCTRPTVSISFGGFVLLCCPSRYCGFCHTSSRGDPVEAGLSRIAIQAAFHLLNMRKPVPRRRRNLMSDLSAMKRYYSLPRNFSKLRREVKRTFSPRGTPSDNSRLGEDPTRCR